MSQYAGVEILTARSYSRRRGERIFRQCAVTHAPGAGRRERAERPAATLKHQWLVEQPMSIRIGHDRYHPGMIGDFVEANTASEARAILKRQLKLRRLPVGTTVWKRS